VLDRATLTNGGDGVVGSSDRIGHEKRRIVDFSAQRIKTADERFARDHGRSLALRMPPHTVDHDQECAAVVAQYGDPVLVLFAMADKTYFCCFVAQMATRGLLD
jgi:hypothetical protein